MKRKNPKRKQPSDAGPTRLPKGDVSAQPAAREIQSAQGPEADRAPVRTLHPALRTWLSIWLSFHLFALLVSFTSVVEPSAIHARLASLVHPYLQPAHFAADDRPVYLAHGDPSEQPHRLQVTTSAAADMASLDTVRWRTVGPSGHAGLAVSDRNQRWLSTAAMLAENDQPGLVAELLLPIVVKDPRVTAIRIVRFPTDLNDISKEIESSYVARVLRDNDLVSLVELKAARLSAHALYPPTGTPHE